MKTIVALLAAAIASASPAAFAAPPEATDGPVGPEARERDIARGEAVAREWDRRNRGFHDTRTELLMILENRRGQRSERRLRVSTLEVPGEDDGDKSLVILDQPRDVKGTALLSYSHILEPDDQWLYLPALKRVKRISSSNKSGPFVGSEFAHEDIVAQDLGKYNYRWLRDEPCGQLRCSVLEQRPRYENSGYTRQVAWYDSDEVRLQRIDYYDRKGELLKSLTLDDYRQYLGRYWRAHDWLTVHHRTGKKTRLVFEAMEFQTGLDESDFTRDRLERVR